VFVAIHDSGSLGQALALEKAEDDDLALLGGQAREAMLDLVERDLLVDATEDRARLELWSVVERDLRLAWSAADRVDESVVGDAEDPGRQRRALRLEAIDLFVHAGEDVGGQVLGFFHVAVEALEQVAKDTRRVTRVELLDGEGM